MPVSALWISRQPLILLYFLDALFRLSILYGSIYVGFDFGSNFNCFVIYGMSYICESIVAFMRRSFFLLRLNFLVVTLRWPLLVCEIPLSQYHRC